MPVLALDLALPKFHSQKVALPGFSCGLCIQYNKNHFDSSLIFSVAPVRHFRLERLANLKLWWDGRKHGGRRRELTRL